ncbi:AAA family ATPase [uncultured Thiothrix sp.]|uniref:AAA family ATPase n=1 Tax=uncultured Thiothrix sp. TaxID=223185 RepID=UPI002602BBDA|nr:AAA family ATPase [uncultured Thiothrix sp.]HMT93264.1 SbcC/MukB-like Walker B domain-containing protein [Thiolinea sp.]
MKILAIRGKNLASLAKLFVVDFTQEPLASTGIFAITGPTGAGKSTLLDALCLALYDDMPRLPREGYRGQNLPDVSGETIAPRDTRTILRRGAAEGFAEVDFRGNDGLTYRAHWSVRRARIKAEGRLQNSEMSLMRLDTEQPIGGARKTEVLAAIAERIGLSFEQFTRAVLLAQNEFSAFLKASDDKRAELLQTLTGTDLFADLSRRAYQRAKLAEQHFDGLRERLVALKILSSAERQQTELASQQAELQVQSLELERSQLEQQLHWYQQAENLAQACQTAAALALTAQEQEQAATERRLLVAQIETVQTVRGVVEHLDRLEQALQTHQAKLLKCQTESEQTEQRQHAAQEQAHRMQVELQQQQAAYQNLQVSLLQARELDTLIQALEPRYSKALAEQQAAAQHLATLQASQVQQQVRVEDLAKQQADTQAWLNTHQRFQVLAEQWTHWKNLLQQAQQSLDKQQLVEGELQTIQGQWADTQIKLEHAQQEFQQSQVVLVQTEQAYREFKQQAAEYDLEQLATQRYSLEQARIQLQAAQQTWQAYQSAQQYCAKLQTEFQQTQFEQQQIERTLHTFKTQLPFVERDCERAEHAWQLASAACVDQAMHWRSQLAEGDACPVCGATAHPYAQQQPALDQVLTSLQQDYLQQRQRLKKLESQVATEQTRLAHVQQQEDALKRSLVEAQQDLTQREQQWQTYASLSIEQAVEQALEQQLKQKQQAVTQINAQEQLARQRYQQRDQAQQAFTQAQQQSLIAQQSVKDTETKLQQLQAQQQYLQTTELELSAQFKAGVLQLNQAFIEPSWYSVWQQAPEVFIENCQQQVTEWQSQQQQQQVLTQQQLELAATQTQVKFEVQQAQDTWERLQAQTQALQEQWQRQQRQRQTLLAGEAVSTVERCWQNALTQLTQQEQAAQQQLAQATHQQIRVAESLVQLQASLKLQETQQAEAQQALVAQLAVFQAEGFVLDLAELKSLLSYTSAWRQQEQQALQALATAVSQTQAVLHERQAQVAQHQQLRPRIESLAAVEAAQATNELNLQTAQQVWQEHMLVLREDLQRREQAAHLQAEVERLSDQARVWGQLNELIGSADGKKFRNFAQQYSLDLLLSYANQHLADLSRRYTLRRVRESLALLVLDQDMGGEIRSVHSLSGGESFLVSLALALGLASLSSQRVKVESLFIDEGFGSLDADSLRIAMDALDQLQAQGRKVGVISHVQEMTERIAVQIQVLRLSGGQSYIHVSGQ